MIPAETGSTAILMGGGEKYPGKDQYAMIAFDFISKLYHKMQ
jgi:hypothetical protein